MPRTLFEVMQEQICNMLEHYVYFTVSKIGMINKGQSKMLEDLVEDGNLGKEILTWGEIIRLNTPNSQAETGVQKR